jgi:predicted RNA binding protein YcfA (HicA-like mRNA interferase family)
LPKLPVVSGPEVVRALKRAGFVVDHTTGSHLIMRHPVSRRRAVVPRHGGRDLRPGTLRAILDDAGLTVEEFIELLR